MIEARKPDRDTVIPIIKLKVLPEQEQNVAPNAVSIAQGSVEPGSTTFGLWDGETPVGLLMFIDVARSRACQEEGDDPDSIYIWRLMIDAAHQGKGYGGRAIALVENHARALGRGKVMLSAVPGPNSPIPFYEKLGYAKTGRIVDDELELAKSV